MLSLFIGGRREILEDPMIRISRLGVKNQLFFYLHDVRGVWPGVLERLEEDCSPQ